MLEELRPCIRPIWATPPRSSRDDGSFMIARRHRWSCSHHVITKAGGGRTRITVTLRRHHCSTIVAFAAQGTSASSWGWIGWRLRVYIVFDNTLQFYVP